MKFLNIQCLRAIAMLLVVICHSSGLINMRITAMPVFLAGASGVDVFFAISGFIMVVTTAGDVGRHGVAGAFLWRRLVRIVPLYWLMTSAKVAQVLLLPTVSQRPVLETWHVIASFLFIPAWNLDHMAQPVIPVGWSLSFEMLFYILFAVALALRRRPSPWLSGFLVFGAFVGLYRTDAWGAPATLLDQMLIEFVFGMLIGELTLAGKRLPQYVALVLAPAMGALLITSGYLTAEPWTHRLEYWGIPGALLLSATVSLEGRWRGLAFRFLCFCGDASYAIYVSHTLALNALGAVFPRLPMLTELGPIPLVVMAIAVCVAVGAILHVSVERPLTARLRGRDRIVTKITGTA